jgi:hypothetical protein
MAELEKIEKIKKVKEATKATEVAPLEEPARVAPSKEHFDRLLQTGKTQPEPRQNEEISTAKKSSPIDEIRELNTKVVPTKVTPTELVAQTEKIVENMDKVKNTLAAPDQKIKESAVPLLNNKLSHIDENLKVALSNAGVEKEVAAIPAAPTENPIMRFMGFLTQGQYQLQTLALEVERMHLNKEELSAASMLAIQIKVGYIQQELEFFSALLNKSLESTKTIMNVQV